jgi:hypothetical protein
MSAVQQRSRMSSPNDLIAVEMTVTYYDSNSRQQTATIVFDKPVLMIQHGDSLLDYNSVTRQLRGGSLMLSYANVTRKAINHE